MSVTQSTAQYHTDMVTALVKPGDQIVASMTPKSADVMHMTLGIAGETGELVDAVKKSIIYGRSLDLTNVIEELGDLEFYMEGLRQTLGITREATLQANIAKLSVRYQGFKYSDESAVARADKTNDQG
jgi:NTP pyrophosphatase (non-canonical NTP hydrolase)